MKLADIHILHRSDFYRIVDFRCHCVECSVTDPEYNTSFSLSFIRNGFFEYRTFRRQDEVHAGRLLISKPGYEHTTRHIDNQPDVVTIFDFRRSFYEEYILDVFGDQLPFLLKNPDIHSVMAQATPGLEYLHQRIYKKIRSGKYDSLEMDEWVLELLSQVMELLAGSKSPGNIPDKMKQYHLGTVERARDFILSHFQEPVSLAQLAAHCLVSPFHFSRVFRSITGSSPHQYLSSVRLTHASILLGETNDPVSEIAYACGYNSPEHFVTAFRQFHRVSPGAFRRQASSKKQDS